MGVGQLDAEHGEEPGPRAEVVGADDVEGELEHSDPLGVHDPDPAERAAVVGQRGSDQQIGLVQGASLVGGVDEALPVGRVPGEAFGSAQCDQHLTARSSVAADAVE